MQPLTNPPHAWVLSRRSGRRASTQAWQRVRLSPDPNTTVTIVIGAGRSNAGRQVTAGVQISTSPFETPTTPQTARPARHTTTKTTVKDSSQSQDLRCSIVQPHLTLCRDRWGLRKSLLCPVSQALAASAFDTTGPCESVASYLRWCHPSCKRMQKIFFHILCISFFHITFSL